MNSEKYENINLVLSRWNPLDVNTSNSINEYSGYISSIVKVGGSKNDLFEYLQTFLIELGVEYNPNNSFQRDNVQKVAKDIFLIINE